MESTRNCVIVSSRSGDDWTTSLHRADGSAVRGRGRGCESDLRLSARTEPAPAPPKKKQKGKRKAKAETEDEYAGESEEFGRSRFILRVGTRLRLVLALVSLHTPTLCCSGRTSCEDGQALDCRQEGQEPPPEETRALPVDAARRSRAHHGRARHEDGPRHVPHLLALSSPASLAAGNFGLEGCAVQHLEHPRLDGWRSRGMDVRFALVRLDLPGEPEA